MSGQRHDGHGPEAEVSGLLHRASSDCADLPDEVACRLDRVLETLPSADTLPTFAAARRGGFLDRWAERLRPKRVRYAILSGAAAVLVTVGAVAVGVQVLSPSESGDSATADMYAQDEGGDDGAAAPDGSGTGAPEEETEALDSEEEAGATDVETFASGSDYSEDADLLAALRDLGAHTAAGEVPDELAELAEGGEFWRACEEAIAERYGGLLVAVDFARYESEPAIMALVVADDGEIALALSPACADGVIEVLASQR